MAKDTTTKGRVVELNETQAELKKRESELRKAENEKRKLDNEMRRSAAAELAAYRKRLKEGVELKRLQVEEIELNIRYYDAKRKWMDLQPAVNELEAQEQAHIQEERRKQEELIKKQQEEALKAKQTEEEKGKKVELTTVKHGKPRSK